MTRHFDEGLKKFKDKITAMASLVEAAIKNGTDALLENDVEKAKTVKKNDHEIDMLEIEIDELGHELIALFQPAAIDLRFITMGFKISNDLERIGDHAANIASRVISLGAEPKYRTHDDLPRLIQSTRKMVKDAVDAFMKGKVELAQRVLDSDDEVDDFYDTIYQDTKEEIKRIPEHATVGLHTVMIGSNLERMADLATNVAEDVIYFKQGKDVRHGIHLKDSSSR